MFKLLLKYMAGLIILGLISMVILYLIAQKMSDHGFEETIKTMNRGVFHSLQERLQAYPESQWPAIINQLAPPDGNTVAIVPLSALHFSKTKMHQLHSGKLIVVKDKDQYYFGYGVSEPISYQRIGQSEFALMMREIPITWIAHRVSAWMTHLIVLTLQQTPREVWPDKIQQLQKIYGIPLSIIYSDDQSWQNAGLVLSPPNPSGKIEYAYAWIADNVVLKIGPIPYLLYPQYQSYILMIIFVLIAIAFIIFVTYIFSRNLDKIYRITEQYSRADFAHPVAVSKHSTLYTLYQNILQMGNKIQNLMNAQQNLTQFVAHECRTPISTMLFAIDHLEKEPLSNSAQVNIQSIKADLADLNALVAAFLNYARFSDQDLPLNKQAVNIHVWMQACVDKYSHASKNIILSSHIPQNTLIEFDPNLMKHVINNLLENALKYADSQVQVTLKLKDNIVIQFDNDLKLGFYQIKESGRYCQSFFNGFSGSHREKLNKFLNDIYATQDSHKEGCMVLFRWIKGALNNSSGDQNFLYTLAKISISFSLNITSENYHRAIQLIPLKHQSLLTFYGPQAERMKQEINGICKSAQKIIDKYEGKPDPEDLKNARIFGQAIMTRVRSGF